MRSAAAHLADNLRQLRAERGLTAAELSSRSGLGKATLSQIEAGRGNPRLETLRDLAAALGVEVTDLLAPPTGNGATVVRRDGGLDISDAVVAGRLVRSLTMPAAVVESMTTASAGRQGGLGLARGRLPRARLRAGGPRAGRPGGRAGRARPRRLRGLPADRPHMWECVGSTPARVWITQVMPRHGA